MDSVMKPNQNNHDNRPVLITAIVTAGAVTMYAIKKGYKVLFKRGGSEASFEPGHRNSSQHHCSKYKKN